MSIDELNGHFYLKKSEKSEKKIGGGCYDPGL